jgi:glycosyltransferase involved in cell wall biosynthesis
LEGLFVSAGRVVYVLSKFPCYDEAFLLREIDGVARRIDTWVFSLRRSDEPIIHDEARALLARTLHVPYLFSLRILRAHARVLLRRPRRWFGALAGLVAAHWRSPEYLVKNLACFPKAVWLGQWSLDNGVTHLHGGWATFPASVALVAAEIAGARFSFAGHAHDIYLDPTGLADKTQRAAFVTTCTASNRERLRALAPNGSEERIFLVHHGVRVPAFVPAPRAEAPLRLLSVGTLQPHKGFEYLVDALARLGAEGFDFQATIVGGGLLEAALRERLARCDLEGRVTMTGALTQTDVVPHYARAAVFVLMAQPEWHWGIPNVIVEALAARNAVITTRFGSVEELVKDGETGILVPPKDPAALAAAIRRLADDPALRSRLADAGHRIVASEFDLDRAVDWYIRRFEGVPA